MNELKKCPFCGSEKTSVFYGNTAVGRCDNCGAHSQKYPEEYGYIAEAVDNDLAVKAWNTRPIEDALQARIPQWISVKDRLPEDDEMKLITLWDCNSMRMAYYYEQELWICNGVDVTGFVTHWMPLPEPPKENE